MLQISRRQWFVIPGMLWLLGGTSELMGESIEWSHDLDRAIQFAAQADKPLLIKVSATWCGPCKRMQRETFSDGRIARQVSQCFVPVALDGDRDSALVRRLGVSAYPTTLVASSDLKIVRRITGYRSPSQLSRTLGGLCGHSSESHGIAAADVSVTKGGTNGPLGDWCPVSPVVDGEFAKGRAEVGAEFRGYEVRFRSDGHRKRFFAAPHRYWPVADGLCVVSWFDEGAVRPGTMRFGIEHRGSIWFFASQECRDRFSADPERYARRLVGEHDAATQP